MNDIYFLQPAWFGGLIFPLLWLWYTTSKQPKLAKLIQPTRVRYPALELANPPSQQYEMSTPLSRPQYAQVLFLVLLIVSLAQPVRDGEIIASKTKTQPVDLILAVNTSISMVLKDYKIDGQQYDRMAVTRLLLQQLVDDFKGRKIGLVILGRPPSLWLPLTHDFTVVQNAISQLKTTLGGRNSDIAETLALIQTQFKSTKTDSDNNSGNTASKKLVLLVSDGYEQLGASSPEAAVKKIIQDGLKLHTLAVGSMKKPAFSLGKGQLIYEPVDLDLLSRLAELGKGKMVHAKNLQATDDVLKNLAIGVPENIPAPDKTLIISLYQYPLTLSLIILLTMLAPTPLRVVFSRSKQE